MVAGCDPTGNANPDQTRSEMPAVGRSTSALTNVANTLGLRRMADGYSSLWFAVAGREMVDVDEGR